MTGTRAGQQPVEVKKSMRGRSHSSPRLTTHYRADSRSPSPDDFKINGTGKSGMFSPSSAPVTGRERALVDARFSTQGDFKGGAGTDINAAELAELTSVFPQKMIQSAEEFCKEEVIYVASLVYLAKTTNTQIVLHYANSLPNSMRIGLNILKEQGYDTENLFSSRQTPPEKKDKSKFKENTIVIFPSCYEAKVNYGGLMNSYQSQVGIVNFEIYLGDIPAEYLNEETTSEALTRQWIGDVKNRAKPKSGRNYNIVTHDQIRKTEHYKQAEKLLVTELQNQNSTLSKAIAKDAYSHLDELRGKMQKEKSLKSHNSEINSMDTTEDFSAVEVAVLLDHIEKAVESARGTGMHEKQVDQVIVEKTQMAVKVLSVARAARTAISAAKKASNGGFFNSKNSSHITAGAGGVQHNNGKRRGS